MGILPLAEALQKAVAENLDLVEVAPNEDPPVCRLMDYGRFRFLQAKKAREARKLQKPNLLREVRLRPRIAGHDREAKLRRVKDLLSDGNKVKLGVFFRGREITHPELGVGLLRELTEGLRDHAKLEASPSMEGRQLFVILAPVEKKENKSVSVDQNQETAIGRETEQTQT